MSDTFLTVEEVAELTGCQTVAMQKRWLDEYRFPYFVSARGKIVMSRVATESHRAVATGINPVPTNAEVMKRGLRIPNDMTAIYFLMKGGRVIYIGKTRSFFVRMAPHAAKKDFDEVIVFAVTEDQLDDMEAEMIARFRPPLNVLGVRKITAFSAVPEEV